MNLPVLSVLIADGSLAYRTLIAQICKELPQIQYMGAVSSLRQLKSKVSDCVDQVIICDIDILENELFEEISEFHNPKISWIFLSRFQSEKALINQNFLHKKAHLTLAKPALDESLTQDILEKIRPSLEMRLKRIQIRKNEKEIALANVAPPSQSSIPNTTKPTGKTETPQNKSILVQGNSSKLLFPKRPPEYILIGVSTGGPSALYQILPSLKENFPLPIIVVQHIPAGFSKSLAEGLNNKCALIVKEAEEGEIPKAGTIYIAPGGIHLTLVQSPTHKGEQFKLLNSAPENSCKPAVDVLFRSASVAVPGKCLSIILTGMGSDGTLGLIELKKSNCFSIVQDEKSSVVWGMPRAAYEAGLADLILPLDQIIPQMLGLIKPH
jgi:two-component system, chemotaxis family, protein-glutamate methylesterase/glutaminase